jgi:hypothetical protein
MAAQVEVKSGEFDLRKEKAWNPKYMWVCDIEEKPGETDNDFLFLANIQNTGTVAEDSGAAASADGGRCIFSSCMYDIQDFTPDTDVDGKLTFALKFGLNTAERKDVSGGWTINFKELAPGPDGSFAGTCSCSWWGERNVRVLPYMTLTPEQMAKYPDLIAKYYKTLPV